MLKKYFHKIGISALSFFFMFHGILYSQTPADALLMEKGELCIAAMYQNDSWNKYWEGSLLRDNKNIGTLSRSNYIPMLAYGLTKRINILATLPYVNTSASGGQMAGTSGFQDLGIFTKVKVIDKSAFQAFTAAGISFPISEYLSDYMPLNLGLGTTEISLRAILKYEYHSKIYFRGSAAYLHRTTTEAERDYYYQDGSIYSTTMNVPDVLSFDAALGCWLWDHDVQLEALVGTQIGQSGDDIRRQNMPQPTNKMDMKNVSGYIRYFPSFTQGFSVFGSVSQVFDGRNVGQSQTITGGITYQFPIFKSTAQ